MITCLAATTRRKAGEDNSAGNGHSSIEESEFADNQDAHESSLSSSARSRRNDIAVEEEGEEGGRGPAPTQAECVVAIDEIKKRILVQSALEKDARKM